MATGLDAFAAGALPAWAVVTPERRAHVERVAAVLGDWAGRLGLSDADRTRWRATGMLHDALRDADPSELRGEAEAPFDTWPASYLHGPITAARLQREGVADADVLEAIRFHTSGRSGLTRLARALIAADYLEPGRPGEPVWRAVRRARLPEDFDAVVRDVAAAKLERAVRHRIQLQPLFVAFWNDLAESVDVGSN